MWFGTVDGLNKFDGHEFTIYQNIPGDKTSLADNSVWALFEDSQDNLWVGTDGGGLSLYDRKTDSFTHFSHDPNDPKSLPHNSVNVIIEDKQGVIWIGTYGGGLSKLISPGKFKNYQYNKNDSLSLSSNIIHSIFEDHMGELWVGTNDGLNLFNKETSTFTRYYAEEGTLNSLNNDNVLSITEDKSGILWLGTWGGGLNAFNAETGNFDHYKFEDIESNRVAYVYVDSSDKLWAGFLEKGLVSFDERNKTLTSITNDHLDPTSLVNNNIWFIYEDDFHNLWLGTEGGISWINRNKKAFHVIDYSSLRASFQNTVITSFEEDAEGNMLFSTEQEVGIISKNNSDQIKLEKLLEVPDIWSILTTNENVLWVSSYGSGLFKFTKESGSYVLHTHFQTIEGVDITNSTYLFEDQQGVLWVGTYGHGLLQHNPSTGSFKHYPLKDSSAINAPPILTISEDAKNNLWLGTYAEGLIKFNKELGRVDTYQKYTEQQTTLSHNTVLSIFQDKKGTIWIGTDGGGLNILDPSTGQIEIKTTKDGLPSNIILGIIADESQHLWLSTNQGLTKYNKTEDTFQNFDMSDGLISKAFNADASFKNKKGVFYFGSGNGFNFFHPDSIQAESSVPSVVFTDLKILNKSINISDGILQNHINVEKSITLNHEQNFFTLNFAALDFTAPSKNKYAYKLEGFNSSWIYTDADNRSATFTNLDQGEYTMHVKASNSDDIWGSESTTLNIKILPPLWKTWWAYSLYVTAFLMISYVIIRAFIIRERLKSNLKIEHLELVKMQEMDSIKSSFFAGISHEFRTPLTLIATPVQELLKKHSDDKEMSWTLQLIKRNANRLLQLINQLLDLSKLEAGKLQLKVGKEDVIAWVKIIAASFESLALSKEIQFLIRLPDDPVFMFFDKEKVEQMVLNLLSNAFKFTPLHGKVEIKVSVTDRQLIIEVTNTGHGIPKQELTKIFDHFYQVSSHQNAAEGTGIGLALVKEFSELHHGKVEVVSETRGETTFTIYIPTSDKTYENDYKADASISEVSKMVEEQVTQQEFSDQLDNISNEETTLLIIEDNDDLRTYLVHQLTPTYRILQAKNGAEGLEIATYEMPDLVITDLMMPEMGGVELINALRKDFKTNHIPIIMLTAKFEKQSRLESLEKGADHYLNKPFDLEELKVRVKSLVTQRTRIRDHYYSEFITSPKAEIILSADDLFLEKAVVVIEDQLDNHEFSVDQFAKALAMSRVQLHRKMKAIIGCSASEFTRHYRLKKAYNFLKKRKGSVSEIAYSVGFNNLSYFTKAFKEIYNINPSELLK